jgi:DNA (cytosine-5)-methyltransferase 1
MIISSKLKVLDLFSGIGGFSLGLEKTGFFETSALCEIEDYPRKVLKRRWPEVPLFEDVRKLKGDQVGTVDLITGGFPCQDLSSAGEMRGIGEGTRSGLFREMLRLATETNRPFILFENVNRLLSGPSEKKGEWFNNFLWSLAESGYDAEWFCLSAASVGAPHLRERLWVIAYPNETQLERGSISRRVHEEHANFSNTCWGKDKPGVVRTLNGVPSQMDRLGCLGNAVVPEIPFIIGKALVSSGAMKTQKEQSE